ncbi:helix-turn-helix transcriptional regulator [Elizabethkingia anophelis]|uniref:helix-turn-helix transcriptional regulator n=1 Tax=Elizabethkingia anophelis TaxID=1117645 RepID=UPI0013FD08FD|nr:helix-turn-helix transcriptional regulator [Elizabethkingia anophelis]
MIKNKLIQLRKSLRFSQQDIAEYLKISQTHYQRKETGSVYIKEEEWQKIASLLNVKVKDIMEEDDLLYTSGDYRGNNNYLNIPRFLLDNEKEYVAKLKDEIRVLKQRLEEYEGKNMKK